MNSELEVSSDTISVRIVPSVAGTSRLVVSTDAPEYRSWDVENGFPTTWKRMRVFLSESRYFNPRHRSLVRSNVLVFGSVCCAWPAYRSPTGLISMLMPLITLIAVLGTADTCRNLGKRWNLRHAGVLLMVYADLMAISLLAFMSVYKLLIGSLRP